MKCDSFEEEESLNYLLYVYQKIIYFIRKIV